MDIKGMLKTLCGMPESFQMDNEIKALLNQEATTVNLEKLLELVKKADAEFEKERNR